MTREESQEFMLNHEEFLTLARQLEQHHSIFEKLWSISKPVFSTELPTAGVYFDKVGECIDFSINPDYWKTLTNTQKQFLISHECLHVILFHGHRMNKLDRSLHMAANYTMDVVVNHSLVRNFGFKREDIDPENKLCWVDTVFPENPPEPGKYFEYYYNLLEIDKVKGSLADSHERLGSFGPEFDKKLGDILTKEELEAIKGVVSNIGQEAGEHFGDICKQADTKKVAKKKKWETVIKKWANQFLKDLDEEQWIRPSRRLTALPKDFFIPSDQEVEFFKKDRIQVWFFQDTSGSCSGFIDRFFGAAKSLPEERFDVRMHCFDTRVYETSLKSGKLYGFGGTSFSCIENYIQRTIKKENSGYPKAVFCITDGFGDRVNPQIPQNWYWFLSDYYTECIPKTCNIFKLKDFE